MRERGVGNKIAPLQHKFWVKWDMSVNKRNFNALQVLIKLNYTAILLRPSRTSAAFLLLSFSTDTELVLWKLCKICSWCHPPVLTIIVGWLSAFWCLMGDNYRVPGTGEEADWGLSWWLLSRDAGLQDYEHVTTAHIRRTRAPNHSSSLHMTSS